MSTPESVPAEAAAPIEEQPRLDAPEPTHTETAEPALQTHIEATVPVPSTEPHNQVPESQNDTQIAERPEPGELPQLDQSALQALWLAQQQHLIMQQQPEQNTEAPKNTEEPGNPNVEAQQALAAFLLQQQQHQEENVSQPQQEPIAQLPPNYDQYQNQSVESLSQHDGMQLDDVRNESGKRQPAPATGPMRGPERSRREEPYPTRSARGGRDPVEVLRETRALYMAGVPPDASDVDVMQFFRDYQPRGARVPRFEDTGKAKGFAFVDFNTFEEAKAALDTLHDGIFMGRTVKLQPSDTPIRHDPDGAPRHDRRPERRERDRDVGRGGWDRDRERDRNFGRDFPRGGDARGDSYREREYGRDHERDYGRDDGRRGGPREDHFRDSDMSRRTSLFIGNLDDRTTERDIFNLFSTCGHIRNIRLLSDKTGRFRGCGFVDYERPEEAQRGMSIAGTKLNGREIRVDFSQPELRSGRGDRDFRDRDRDRERDSGRDSYRDRPYSPPRHHDARDMGPPRGYPPHLPPPAAPPAPAMDPFAQLAQVPGLLQLLNPQAAALAAAAAAAQQQQPSNDLSSLLRSLGGAAPASAPQDPNLAYLQAIMAAGGASQGQQMSRPSGPYDQQASQLSSLLGMSSSMHQQPQAPQSYQQYPQHQHDDYRGRPSGGSGPQMGSKYNPSTQPISKRPPGCKTVFLAALPDATTEADLRGIFEQCGKVERIRWLNDRATGRFRGCGFVDFYDEVGPVKAVNFNGALIHGVPIRVDYAIPKQFE